MTTWPKFVTIAPGLPYFWKWEKYITGLIRLMLGEKLILADTNMFTEKWEHVAYSQFQQPSILRPLFIYLFTFKDKRQKEIFFFFHLNPCNLIQRNSEVKLNTYYPSSVW